MKKLIVFLLTVISLTSYGQVIPFNVIPTTGNDFVAPGRGAEDWNGQRSFALPTATSPDSSIDYYFRFQWSDIQNLTTGAFYWSNWDYRIQIAIDKGAKFNWGVMGFYPGSGISYAGYNLSYPVFLHQAMQGEGVKDFGDNNNYSSWSPNWNSTNFRNYYNTLIDSIVAHTKATTYKGVNQWDAVGRVDIRTYGNTGEWTGWTNAYNPSGNSGTIATYTTQNTFIDDFVSRIPDKQLVICIAAAVGANNVDGQPNEVAYHVFTTSNNVGRIGLRRDCLGQTDAYMHNWLENNPTTYNGKVFKNEIMNIYKVAPWVGEPCSCCGTSNPITTDTGGLAYGDMPRQMTFYHMASFGNGNLTYDANVNQTKDSLRKASYNTGYRIYPSVATLTGNTIVVQWNNVGVTPTYENWTVSFELRSGSSVIWTKTSNFIPKLFLPGSTTVTDTLANGTGDLYVIIRDPAGYRKPLPLAITGRGTDGAYLIKANTQIGSVVTTPCPACPTCPAQRYAVGFTINKTGQVITTYNDGSTSTFALTTTISVH